jgi:zinc transporter ZupT
VLKVIYGSAIFLLTLFAGIYPFFKHSREEDKPFDFRSGESLACGVFLGAGLLHMLGESSELLTNQGIHYPLAFLLCGAVFLLFLWLEHLGKEYYHHSKKHDNYFAFIVVIMMSIHSLLSGSALGLSDEMGVTAILFFAIISHKLAESFAIAIQLVKANMSFKMAFALFVLYACMTPLGISLGYIMMQSSVGTNGSGLMVPIFTALAAGTFLYMGTLHGLEKCVLVKQCCNLKYFSFVILGFVIMAIMAMFV